MNDEQDYLMPNSFHEKQVKMTRVGSNRVMDLSNGSSENGTRVHVWEDNGTDAQRWVLRKIDMKAPWSPWIIQNAASGTWLDLANGSDVDGTPVQCWGQSRDDVRGNPKSQWYFISQEEHHASSVFRLQNAGSSTYANQGTADLWGLAGVKGYHRKDDNDDQKWLVQII